MNEFNTNIVFSLVVYNEFYWEVDSFKSLLKSFYKSETTKTLNIYIFDNTVYQKKADKPYFERVNVKYMAFGDNKGISKSYNYLATLALSESFNWIVFLDQDTLLPIDFFQKYLEASIELDNRKEVIACPIVKSGSKILSPSIYKNYRTKLLDDIPSKLELKNHSVINTGLLINCEFYQKVGGYNEELFLDFCDHDFILKIEKYIKYLDVINAELQQDFSVETNSLEKALSRYRIFINDLKSFKRNRNKFVLFFLVDIPHLLRLLYKYRSFKFLKFRFK